MANEDNIKKPIKDWLLDFYDDTGKISEIVRNLALAGIGIIWIFKNEGSQTNILPKELIQPLLLIVAALGFDLLQYIYRALSNYILYRIYEKMYDSGRISEDQIADVKMPAFVEIGVWVFFGAKIILTLIAYAYIYFFFVSKI